MLKAWCWQFAGEHSLVKMLRGARSPTASLAAGPAQGKLSRDIHWVSREESAPLGFPVFLMR
ncbi:hypothetical protein HMPREF2128_00820 [Pseudoglutamicibacter albus DNF00011]|uniref:Uncharacterized protein n=1 Tax=Pseudoglutamicibacter albus DNF00011 TaxID=1401063 RepID=A0A095YGE4_9MICC|nr:hypothetical protein HMPREF2128_00820 [Pseudoglutamicibacter albus DNF00011]